MMASIELRPCSSSAESRTRARRARSCEGANADRQRLRRVRKQAWDEKVAKSSGKGLSEKKINESALKIKTIEGSARAGHDTTRPRHATCNADGAFTTHQHTSADRCGFDRCPWWPGGSIAPRSGVLFPRRSCSRPGVAAPRQLMKRKCGIVLCDVVDSGATH